MPSLQISFEAASSLISNGYPDLLCDPSISDIIRSVTSEKVQGVLMVQDLGCGKIPVSPKLFSKAGRREILAVDRLKAIDHAQGVSYAQQDIRDIRKLKEINGNFFARNSFDGKNHFDVVVLSNVVNYIVTEGEKVGRDKISDTLRLFIEEYLTEIIGDSGKVIIQNGDMSRRYIGLKESQINDYFSKVFEEVLGRFFQDLFYLGFAVREKRRFLRKSLVDIKDFQSHAELREIDGEAGMKVVCAGNIRCIKLK